MFLREPIDLPFRDGAERAVSRLSWVPRPRGLCTLSNGRGAVGGEESSSSRLLVHLQDESGGDTAVGHHRPACLTLLVNMGIDPVLHQFLLSFLFHLLTRDL